MDFAKILLWWKQILAILAILAGTAWFAWPHKPPPPLPARPPPHIAKPRPPKHDIVTMAPVATAPEVAGVPMQGDVSDENVGKSNGDVHIRTGDGMYYDFQPVGEFIAVWSADPGFQIQVRQAPWQGTSKTVSTNIGVAMNVGGDRVGVYARRQDTLFVNGKPVVSHNGAMTLPKGGYLRVKGNETSVFWPDGSNVKIVSHSGDYLDFQIDIAPGRAGKVSGLFGNFDGDSTNELVPRKGLAIATWDPVKKAALPLIIKTQLYGEFGNSWRITQAESLFDYADGETTATFTDPNFPYTIVRTSDLSAEVRAKAEAACRAAGITDSRFLENCIYDVGVTGSDAFAQSTAQAQADVKMPEGFECVGLPGGGSRCTEYEPSLKDSRIGALYTITVETRETGGTKATETFDCSRIDKLHRASCKIFTKGKIFEGALVVSRYTLENGQPHEDRGTMERH